MRSRLLYPEAFRIQDQEKSIPRHTSVRSTLPLTETTMSTDSSCSLEVTSARSGVHGDWLADDESISNELANGLSGVGIADLVRLVGIEPDLSLSASNNRRRKALLGTEVDPVK